MFLTLSSEDFILKSLCSRVLFNMKVSCSFAAWMQNECQTLHSDREWDVGTAVLHDGENLAYLGYCLRLPFDESLNSAALF